ncbi:MAG TPA: EamA family transporter [Thermoanaerobaculia bacterium]|jgi:drug/metabolite transporter (DMT)-like permease
MADASLRVKVAVALGLVYLIWGSTYLAIRYAVATIPPLSMAGVRFLIAGAMLYVWARWRGAPAPDARQWRSAGWVGLLLLVGGNGLVVWAEQRVDSGLTALLVSTTPIFMVLLPWWGGKARRPRLAVLVGIFVGLAGVALLVKPSGVGGVDIPGTLVLSLASLAWALGSLYSRTANLPASPLLATGIQMLAGGAQMLAVGVLLGEPARFHLAQVSAASLWGFLYLIVAAVVAFTAYLWLLRAVSPTLVSTYSYVNPLVAVFLGWAIAGEPVTGRTLIAAVIIVASVAMITLARSKESAPPERLSSPAVSATRTAFAPRR